MMNARNNQNQPYVKDLSLVGRDMCRVRTFDLQLKQTLIGADMISLGSISDPPHRQQSVRHAGVSRQCDTDFIVLRFERRLPIAEGNHCSARPLQSVKADL